MSRWSGVAIPTVTRRSCRHGCGQNVDTFTDEIGLRRQLDTTPPPITLDLSGMRHRVWEDRGKNVGWCLKFSPARSWREIRLSHECEKTPERERMSEREHEKENKR